MSKMQKTSKMSDRTRYLVAEPSAHLKRPVVKLQPILAKQGQPNIDLKALAEIVKGVGELAPTIAIESPEHWARSVKGLGRDFDGILPVSITAYPTEIWNSHPQPLAERQLPFIFWSIIAYDEPDFWRWSATDFLRAIGVPVFPVKSNRHGLALLRALAMKRFLADSKMVVFGEQNFPWNAPVAGHLVTESLGTKIVVRGLADFRSRYDKFSKAEIEKLWQQRKGRYKETTVHKDQLELALRTYLAIKSVLEEERAMGFGVNCFGELVIRGGRDVPCLAQTLLREDGYIASCDGDYLAMMCMVFCTYMLDKTCMMSNMYPVQYVGALKDHFGDPLSPPTGQFPKSTWKNLARFGHCGFVGVVSPEMTSTGKAVLQDWGGTYEIKRDGRGCGIDSDMPGGQKVTALQLKFDGKTLLIGDAEICQTTRHRGMPHCESTALVKFRDLEGFVDNISREHTVMVYGDHIEDFKVMCQVLSLNGKIF